MILKLAAVLWVLVLCAGSSAADWEKLPPLPEPNGGFTAVADSGGITVIGGTNWMNDEKLWLRSITHFDPKKNRWDVREKIEHPVAYAVASAHQSDDGTHQSPIMLGGSDGTRPAKAVAVIDTIKTAFVPTPALPDAIVLSAGGIIGGRFIVVGGGVDAADFASFTRRTFALDLKTRAITPLPDFTGAAFGMAASCVVSEELLVFGGANFRASDRTILNSADAHAFSTSTKQWRRLTPLPLRLRGAAAVMLDEHRAYIAGGFGGDPEAFHSEAFIYDTRTDTYAAATALPHAALVVLVKLDGWLYCLGGEDRKKHRTDAAFRIRWKELLPR
ncbi:MAG: kelch repeat-containing protein [Chthoniobacteraceae bacterium]